MKTIPWILSFALHVLALFIVMRPTEKEVFGVEAGRNSVEVNLVAAPQEPTTSPVQEAIPPPVVPEAVSPNPEPDFSVAVPTPTLPPQPQRQPAPPVPQESPKPPTPVPHVERGDGSSVKPGKDAMTAHSDAGAIQSVKPDYLRNPSPAYPESARRQKQEGLVVLNVMINMDGRPDSITVEASSGFPLLDQAAVEAVRHWRFRPATAAGIRVLAQAQVPIRFRLEN